VHLLLATLEDPYDPKSWSGTAFHMRLALERNFTKVSVLGAQKPRRTLFHAILRLVLGKNRYPLWMTSTALRAYGQRLNQAISDLQPDAILCISSQHLIYSKLGKVPSFMISDAPWMAYKQAYSAYDPMPILANHYARMEAKVARELTAVIYPTTWACNEAIERFDIPSGKCMQIALGANRFCPHSEETISESINQRTLQPLNLLFIGKDWDRKGGPLALRITKALNEIGVDANLSIVGCSPELSSDEMQSTRVIGFLSPDDRNHVQRMEQAFAQADFLLVPSQAECYGLVFAEAQSYGLPCLALNVQGIPSVIDHQRSGLLFDPNTNPNIIAREIQALINEPTRYRSMAEAARQKYLKDLNWDQFGRKIYAAITSR